MEEIKVKTKKWGNSLGVIIPKKVVREQNIKPEQEVSIQINPNRFTTGKDIWGTMKFKKSTDQLMKEVDEDMDFGF